ncbi:MAG: SMC-Scp complex subunit ScpB [Candidatus Omnitrophica bacterium]|nr:SMC-Scp complex subunit ScpB [Candidatus Omnitrophota bacterium]
MSSATPPAESKRILEGILFACGDPVPAKRLVEVLPDLDAAAIRQLVGSLQEEYRQGGRAFQIQEVAGGFQLVTDRALAPWIAQALSKPRPDSVSHAAMETLAIIAYRQPVTKAEIEAVRGVDITASLDGLLEKQFIRIVGRKESPGRPFLYGTTPEFLRHFGLKSVEALPPMAQPVVQEPEAPPAATPAAEPVPASPDAS